MRERKAVPAGRVLVHTPPNAAGSGRVPSHHLKDPLMSRFRSAIALALALGALSTAPAMADDYPFIGAWDCGVGTFTITTDVYNNGSEDMPIQEIQEGSDGSWTLLLTDDYFVTVSGFQGDSMGWMSSSGESLECTRVN